MQLSGVLIFRICERKKDESWPEVLWHQACGEQQQHVEWPQLFCSCSCSWAHSYKVLTGKREKANDKWKKESPFVWWEKDKQKERWYIVLSITEKRREELWEEKRKQWLLTLNDEMMKRRKGENEDPDSSFSSWEEEWMNEWNEYIGDWYGKRKKKIWTWLLVHGTIRGYKEGGKEMNEWMNERTRGKWVTRAKKHDGLGIIGLRCSTKWLRRWVLKSN